MIRAFVNNPRNFEEIKSLNIFKLHEELSSVGSYKNLSSEFKQIVKNEWDGLFRADLYQRGIYKIGGWEFNFREWMMEFWVEEKENGILRYYSFNKTIIRENHWKPSNILKIVEVS